MKKEAGLLGLALGLKVASIELTRIALGRGFYEANPLMDSALSMGMEYVLVMFVMGLASVAVYYTYKNMREWVSVVLAAEMVVLFGINLVIDVVTFWS